MALEGVRVLCATRWACHDGTAGAVQRVHIHHMVPLPPTGHFHAASTQGDWLTEACRPSVYSACTIVRDIAMNYVSYNSSCTHAYMWIRAWMERGAVGHLLNRAAPPSGGRASLNCMHACTRIRRTSPIAYVYTRCAGQHPWVHHAGCMDMYVMYWAHHAGPGALPINTTIMGGMAALLATVCMSSCRQAGRHQCLNPAVRREILPSKRQHAEVDLTNLYVHGVQAACSRPRRRARTETALRCAAHGQC